MRIDIVYRDKTVDHEEIISSFYNFSCDPFNIGDEINLTISEINPIKLGKFTDIKRKFFIDNNNEKRDKYHLKKIKLIEKNLYSEIKYFEEDELIIEYYCKFIS